MSEFSGLPNPFRENIVQDAWQSPLDVADIHAAAFSACLAGVESAQRGVPDSLLIYGAAGSGKTHLLTRVQRHLAETAQRAPDQVLPCVFSFVRLQTSPQLLWQHVRRRLASDLMRRDQGLTQLQRLIAHQIGVGSGRSPRAGVLELRVLGAEDNPALREHLSELGTRLDLPRDLCVVLEQLTCNRLVRDASAWLAGDNLPESVLAELGLGADLDEDREQAARGVVTALCRLAGETLPIVFCFDQVEALQRTATDNEAFFRFGRMAADLHDADANVFLITCLQSAVFEQFKGAIRSADFERVARRHVTLHTLSAAQVERLIASRLEAVPGLKGARTAHPEEPCYPLSRRLVEELARESPCVPRRVLAAATRAFEELQHGRAAPRPTAGEFLDAEREQRQKEAQLRLSPADTLRVVVGGAQVLAALEHGSVTESEADPADFVIEGRGRRRAAVSVRNEVDGRSLGPKLKALLSNTPRKDGARVVVVRDPRRPISKNAVKAREHLAELQRRGAVLVEPGVEALAALDALASILGDAKSGDLACDGQALGESAVLGWLRSLRSELGVEPVRELIDALLDEDASTGKATDGDEQDLADLLGHEHVIELEMAARILDRTPERVRELARQATGRCLVLEGPPAVLLDMAGIASESEPVARGLESGAGAEAEAAE
jgi:hypothetical protein